MLLYGSLKIDEFFLDEIALSNGQTAREFVIERGVFNYIKTVRNLDDALAASGLERLTNEALERARKPRLIDANVMEKKLREREIAMVTVSKSDFPALAETEQRIMESARNMAKSVPTAYDKERVLEKIASLYPQSKNGNENVYFALDKCMEIVRRGGI